MSFSNEEIDFLIRSCQCNYAFDESDISKNNTIHITVLNKLLAMCDFTYKNNSFMENPVNEKLFMGAGNYSVVFLNKLHKRLEFAAMQLSALQQNGGMGTEFDDYLDKKCTTDIINVIKDIMIAFDISKSDL